MTVDKAYKGALNSTIELLDSGMCDGPDLQPGRQYLMYTSGDPNKPVDSRGCTRSRAVEFAKEDLEFLNLYTAGKTKTHVEGTIRFLPDLPTHEKLTPLEGVEVSLSGNGTHLSATTTVKGQFSFPEMAAGTYSIEALHPGFYLSWAPKEFKLVANGCSEFSLQMRTDRRVQGTVNDQEGKPLKGVRVEMVTLKPDREYQSWLSDISDKSGHYTIQGIPPGKFLLGINIESPPTDQYPHPRLYYPSTSDRQTAAWITIPEKTSVQEFHLQAAPKLEIVTIHGRVEMLSGKPPSNVDFPHIHVESAEGKQLDNSPIVDPDGRFKFELCKGATYSVWVSAGDLYSDRIKIKPENDSPDLVLIPAKTFDQFDEQIPH